MIRVSIRRNAKGFPCGFLCKGHAGYADPGQDIICSAVTAMATMTITGLTDVLHLHVQYRLDEGHIECSVPLNGQVNEANADRIELLMETFELGCRQLEDSHNGKYIKVDQQH